MNVSLLAKWRWRLLNGEIALSKDVLEEKYGHCKEVLLGGVVTPWPRNASVWWKDLVKLEDFGGAQGWFNSEVFRKVGNGFKTSFWKDIWRGGGSFAQKYPRLFSISTQKEATVGEIGAASGVGTDWNFNWRRQLFVWEELFTSLREDLEGMVWSNEESEWRWKLEDNGFFSVKSAYLKLEGVVLKEDLWDEEERGVFDQLWKSPAPSKVIAFTWKVLLNRIPTRVNLALRNVLPPDASNLCVLGNLKEESAIHLLLHCEVASKVWLNIMLWLEVLFLIPPNFFVHWECWSVGERNKKVTKGLWLIWHTTMWTLWKARNDKIFKGISRVVDDIVEEIKVLSWRWMLNRTNNPPCLFYEWCWNPRYCLAR